MPWYGIVILVLVVLAALVWAFRQWFRRDPERTVPGGEIIVAPADGKVLEIRSIDPGNTARLRKGLLGHVEALTDGLGDGPFTLVSIFMDLFDVHVNRSPLAGKVMSVAHQAGRLRRANHPLAIVENEKTETVLETPVGRMKVLQVAGLIARRVDNWLAVGQEITTGERIGLIHFGSQLSVVMPESDRIRVTVEVGQKTRAGETVLATFGEPIAT